jgi:hypothetical protein
MQQSGGANLLLFLAWQKSMIQSFTKRKLKCVALRIANRPRDYRGIGSKIPLRIGSGAPDGRSAIINPVVESSSSIGHKTESGLGQVSR